jgi:hypothetical protein
MLLLLKVDVYFSSLHILVAFQSVWLACNSRFTLFTHKMCQFHVADFSWLRGAW